MDAPESLFLNPVPHWIGYARVRSVDQYLNSQLDALQWVSLRENIDTSTSTGRCFPSMMGAIPPMERELRAERTSADQASTKTRGKTRGRPRTNVVKLENAKVLYENSEKTADEVCKVVGVGRRIFFTYLAQQREMTHTH